MCIETDLKIHDDGQNRARYVDPSLQSLVAEGWEGSNITAYKWYILEEALFSKLTKSKKLTGCIRRKCVKIKIPKPWGKNIEI